MYEHDTTLNNSKGLPSISYGPRHNVGDDSVEACPPEEAEFWGIYIHPAYDVEVNCVCDAPDQPSAALVATALHAHRGNNDEYVTQLPDGSGFMTGKFPLPKDHWLYSEERQTFSPEALFPSTLRFTVETRAREAIRRATMSGKDMDFDPDALVQNLSVLLLGPYVKPAMELEAIHDGGAADTSDTPDRPE